MYSFICFATSKHNTQQLIFLSFNIFILLLPASWIWADTVWENLKKKSENIQLLQNKWQPLQMFSNAKNPHVALLYMEMAWWQDAAEHGLKIEICAIITR